MTTVAELYPPKPIAEVEKLTREIIAFRPDGFGAPELHRALSIPERQMMAARKAVLDKWMEPGGPSKMKAAINEMFNGFAGPQQDEEERDILNANYAYACRERPLWAVKRACLKFRSGEVRAADVGEEKLSTTWKPSSAQVNLLAKKIEEDIRTERYAVTEILRATVYLPAPRPVGREKVDGAIGAVAQHMQRRRAEKDLEGVERQLQQEADADRNRAAAITAVDQSYVRAGLVPPKWQPGQIPVSLQMKLSFGWRIEDVDGRPTLVSPPKVSAPVPASPALDDQIPF